MNSVRRRRRLRIDGGGTAFPGGAGLGTGQIHAGAVDESEPALA